MSDAEKRIDLLPCPFCGSANVKLFRYPPDKDGDNPDFVQCQNCASDGPYGSGDTAIYKWNRRADPIIRREIENAAYERAAGVCDEYADEQWDAYKGRNGVKDEKCLCNPHTEGMSDGASECAAAIRALKKEAK